MARIYVAPDVHESHEERIESLELDPDRLGLHGQNLTKRELKVLTIQGSGLSIASNLTKRELKERGK